MPHIRKQKQTYSAHRETLQIRGAIHFASFVTAKLDLHILYKCLYYIPLQLASTMGAKCGSAKAFARCSTQNGARVNARVESAFVCLGAVHVASK